MWVLRPTDGEGVKLFVEPRVQMLAQDWQPPYTSEFDVPKRRHHRQAPPRHHHLHFRMHTAHG